MTLTSVQAIEAMVAPVVLITAGGILSNGVMSISASVNDRMRTMNHERLALLTDPDGGLKAVEALPAAHRARMGQIDAQMPMLARRHHLMQTSLLTIYLAVATLVVAVVTLGVAVPAGSDQVGLAALALILLGTTGLLASLVMAAMSTLASDNAIDYETRATASLGTGG